MLNPDVKKIYEDVGSHFLKGIMFHEELIDYFLLLGLEDYSKIQKEHYLDEVKKYTKFKSYYIRHHGVLLKQEAKKEEIIPSSWYNYEREEFDIATKQKALKNALSLWKNWEQETKTLLENAYIDLMNLGQVMDATFILKFLKNTDKELCEVESIYLTKKSQDFTL